MSPSGRGSRTHAESSSGTETSLVQPSHVHPRTAGWQPSRWRARPFPPLALTALAIVYLGVHLLTLERSPLPWFDDTFFASITDSVVRNGELRLSVSPLWIDQPIYIYGPAYFAVTSVVARAFAFDAFFFRLPCLVFSLGIVIVVGLVLRRHKVAPAIATWTCVLLALDPTLYKSSHSGRMDSMALFFILLSLLAMPARLRATRGASVGRALLSGLAAGVALLTTPRPAYLLVAIGCILAYRFARERSRDRAIELIVWSGSAAALYGSWFWYAFGSVGNLLDYYVDVVPGEYLGGFGVRLVHAPLLVGLFVLAVATGNPRRLASELMFFVSSGIAGFYVIVREPGLLYSFFMVPLAYMGMGYLAAQLVERDRRAVPLMVLSSLLLVNGLAYVARNAFVVAQWAASDTRIVDQAVAAYIPRGSRVIGDDKYFFAVRKAGSDFQYMSRGGTTEERVAYHRDVFRADYLVTDRDEQSPLILEYVREMGLTRAGAIPGPPPGPLARQLLRLANVFNFTPETGYRGSVWAREAAQHPAR